MTATASHDVFLTWDETDGLHLTCSCGWRYRWHRSVLEPAEVAEVAAEHLELADRPPIDLETLSPLERAMAAIVTVAALKAMHRPNTARLVAALAERLEREREDTWDDYETDTWWPAIDRAKQAEMAAERHRIAGGISDDAPVFEAAPDGARWVDQPALNQTRQAGRDPLEVAAMDAHTRAVSLGQVAPPAVLLAEPDQEAGYAIPVPFPASFDAAEHAQVPTCPTCRHTHQPGTFCGVQLGYQPDAREPDTCQCEGWPA